MGINAVERTVELNGPSDLWARRRRTSSLTVELPASGPLGQMFMSKVLGNNPPWMEDHPS